MTGFLRPSGFGEDDCVIFDCPGQIELYSHHFAFSSLIDRWRCGVAPRGGVYARCPIYHRRCQVYCRMHAVSGGDDEPRAAPREPDV